MLCPSAWGPQLDHGPTKSKLIIFFPTIILMPNQKDNPIPRPPLHVLQVYVARTTLSLHCFNPL